VVLERLVSAASASAELPAAPPLRHGAFRGILAVADQGVSSATTFLCTALIGRSTSKEEFGIYALGLTVLVWSVGLQSAFVTTPYMYRQANLVGSERRRLAGSTLIHQLVLAVLATVVVAFAAVVAGRIAPPGVAMTARALAVCIGAVMLKEYGRQLSLAHRRPAEALALDIAVFVLQIGGFAWLARSGRASSASAYVVTGLACGLAAVAWVARHRQVFQVRHSAASTDLRDNWAFGKWLFAGAIVTLCAKDMYGWVLTAFHGTAAAAVLAACMGIVMLAQPVIIGVGNHLGPTYARLLAEQGHAPLTRSVGRGTWVAAAFAISLVGAVLLFGEWAIGWVYGPQYLGNRLVLVGLALSLGTSILTMPIGVGLLALQRADLTFRAASVGALGTLVIGVSCARAFGPLGAALGLLSVNALESTTKVVLFRRCMQQLAREGGTTT